MYFNFQLFSPDDMHIFPTLYKGSCLAQSQSPGTMMGNKALLILQVSLGLVCSHYYVSTEKYEDLSTGGGEAITEVEGFGPSGPPDQTDQSRPVPIEVRTYFNLLSEI